MKFKNVLIIGANSDIAREFIYLIIDKTDSMLLLSRSNEKLIQFKDSLTENHQGKISIFSYDGSLESIDDSFNFTQEFDLIFNAAGSNNETNVDIESFKSSINSNFSAPFYLTYRLSKTMTSGTVVSISSIAGDRGRMKNILYGATKSAMTSAMSGLRQKLANSNVSVITVIPGYVRTKMTEGHKMPKILTSSPSRIAKLCLNGIKSRKNIIYPIEWLLISVILRLIPEFIFKRLRF
ncbi:MAG: SDR family NAD(P)-dependent oxidoreductase [SAR86 cluster bacterium]|nr:SDR family NAD(P)-dependent oxidoreductase [SAR86 cluster bacterium]